MAHRKVYLAVGRTGTRIYRFDPIDGDTRVVDNVGPYESGCTAMGAQHRGDDQEPLLLAVSGNKLITIDVAVGTPKDQVIDGLPKGPWFDGDMDPDGKTLFVAGNPDTPSYATDVAAGTATPRDSPGGGRWDDFAYHPKDGRLYSVEGDNGDLLLIDPGRQPMKTVLKAGVFPPAQASGAAGSRKAYTATFFDQDGNFYAVDSAGNVNHLDLTTAEIPDHSQRIGRRGRVPVGDLEIVNGAGRITPLPVPPSYDEIVVTSKFKRTWENGEPRGRVYSFDLTLTAVSKDSGTAEDVREFRISFDLPAVKGAKAEASGVDVIAQDRKAYLSSVGDQFLAAGTSRTITVLITVPGDPTHLPREYPLDGLRATRLLSH
ncbi:hypothetical protein AB0G64_29280 [Streptomyces longwoodensis]|uniref:DUF6923 family protein n=1 Tax=Streptomyces longwoodensis TaxID=68231 RepID=UPI0033F1A66A